MALIDRVITVEEYDALIDACRFGGRYDLAKSLSLTYHRAPTGAIASRNLVYTLADDTKLYTDLLTKYAEAFTKNDAVYVLAAQRLIEWLDLVI